MRGAAATVTAATVGLAALLLAAWLRQEIGPLKLPPKNLDDDESSEENDDDSAEEEEEDDSKPNVYRIVLTGGPCAGKTTALARLSGFLSERGFRVFTVPEMATMLFVNGASIADLVKHGDPAVMAFQRAVIDSQLAVEDAFGRVAAATGSPSVLLCDRGVLDGAAYMRRDLWKDLMEAKAPGILGGAAPDRKKDLLSPRESEDIIKRSASRRSMKENGGPLSPRSPRPLSRSASTSSIQSMATDLVHVMEGKLCERYDAVFHLVTAAEGAERFYSLENNAARTEDMEGARQADAQTQRVWRPHPRHIIFDNSAASKGFEGKLQRVVEATAKLVGLPVLPKGTRKFLLPSLPADEIFIANGVQITSFHVTKTFLKAPTMYQQDDTMEDEDTTPSKVTSGSAMTTASDFSLGPPALRRRDSHASDGETVSGDAVYCHTYVRLRWQVDGSPSYGHVTVHVDPLTLEVLERKRRCSPREYFAHLDNADPDRVPVQQRRIHFLHKHQSFVIHQYLDRLDNLAICHCQAARNDEEPIDFPPFLEIGDEVTDNPAYSAYHLSQKNPEPSPTKSLGSPYVG